MLGSLLFLTVTFFLLTVYNILQANVSLFLLPEKAANFFNFKIMDTSTAASLFVTLLGALLVRHQFALGLLPRIIYRSTNAIKNNTIHPGLSFETWRVEIRNSGLGPAVINNSFYTLELFEEKEGCQMGNFHDIINELCKSGLVRDNDYWLENITAGFALCPKDDCIVFEIKLEYLEKIKRLDMLLYFQNQLGGKHSQEIYFIPRVREKYCAV